jgi:hypothetical protein
MRMIMKVTGIVQSSDSHLSVELHGKHGKAQLNLPTGQRVGLQRIYLVAERSGIPRGHR